MQTKYLLAHDLGTSGNKATLYTTTGKLVKSVVYEYHTSYFNNNWVEQDAADWWESVKSTSKEIAAGIDPRDIAAISFSGHMMGCLCVDKNGEPLRKSIIWADQRAVKETDMLLEKIDPFEFYKIVGHRASQSYAAAKLCWIKHNEPEIYQNTYKMLHCKDYVAFKFTGVMKSDPSDASGTNLFDINTMEWSPRLIKAWGLDADKLPEVVPSTTVIGSVTAKAAQETGLAEGTPVVMGGGDGMCASVGAASIKAGATYCSLGTSSWICTTTERPIFDPEMRTFNWAHVVPGMIGPTGTMQTAGSSYSWLKNEICRIETQTAKQMGVSPYRLIDKEIAKSRPGANGLLFLPYLLGERSPRWNADAKGAFIGLKMEHTREDILRSVLEGVTMNLNVILNVFREKMEIRELCVIGGGAKGDVWREIMANTFGIDILKPNFLEEATSMGAAVTAGVGVGIFKDFEVINDFISIEDRICPDMEKHKVYQKLMPIFDESYQALLGVYDKLSAL